MARFLDVPRQHPSQIWRILYISLEPYSKEAHQYEVTLFKSLLVTCHFLQATERLKQSSCYEKLRYRCLRAWPYMVDYFCSGDISHLTTGVNVVPIY